MEILVKGLEKKFTFNNSISKSELLEVESALKLNIPLELKSLLIKTNGITDNYGFDVIWSARKILDQNHSFRANDDFKELYMPFDNLLFFAEEANGDLYAYVVLNNLINRADIFIWDHETDSRIWFASNLEKYLEKRLN